MTTNKHDLHCKDIGDDLDMVANGQMYFCAECGGFIIDDEPEPVERIKCHECGSVNDVDGLEPVTMLDYLGDVYDIKWTLNSDMTYNGVRLLIAFGGPNIYVDTVSGRVDLYWWSERGSCQLSRDALHAIDDVFNEYYECSR